MATTTSNLKSPTTWLEISLECQCQENKIELLITFKNTTVAAQDFSFSNQAHKAELLGLYVSNLAGQRVIPTHNLVVKPAKPAIDPATLEAGACFTYALVGNLTEYGMEFPGAIFELPAGESYQLQFKYAGKISNRILLSR